MKIKEKNNRAFLFTLGFLWWSAVVLVLVALRSQESARDKNTARLEIENKKMAAEIESLRSQALTDAIRLANLRAALDACAGPIDRRDKRGRRK